MQRRLDQAPASCVMKTRNDFRARSAGAVRRDASLWFWVTRDRTRRAVKSHKSEPLIRRRLLSPTPPPLPHPFSPSPPPRTTPNHGPSRPPQSGNQQPPPPLLWATYLGLSIARPGKHRLTIRRSGGSIELRYTAGGKISIRHQSTMPLIRQPSPLFSVYNSADNLHIRNVIMRRKSFYMMTLPVVRRIMQRCCPSCLSVCLSRTGDGRGRTGK